MTADHSPRQIDLAQEPAFSLGPLEVRPATLEVIAGERREQLEPRIMQVLVALARQRGEVVSRDMLIATCWDGRVVGDDSINRCISRLRKLAEDLGGFEIETVPRVGFRLTERDRKALHGARRLARPWVLLGVAICAVILVAGLWAWRTTRTASESVEPRVAVTTFQVLDEDPAARLLAAKLADDIRGVLDEHLAGVGVAGAAAAQADLLLGGTVSRDGDTWRVRATLIERRGGAVLWSGRFDRPSAEQEQLRDQVAVAAVETVFTARDGFQQPGLKVDPQTLALYIKAGELQKTNNVLQPEDARRGLEQVIARSPHFAAARGSFAGSLMGAAGRASPAEANAIIARIRREAARALKDDPRAGAAYDALYGAQRFEKPTDVAAAEDVLLAGLARAPWTPWADMRECRLLVEVGRANAAVPYCERGLALRPMGSPLGHSYVRALNAAGRGDLARTNMERFARFHPDNYPTRALRLEMAMDDGAFDEALRLLRSPATRPQVFTGAAVAALESLVSALRSRRPGDATIAMEALRSAAARRELDPRYVIIGATQLGRLDDAFATLAPLPPRNFIDGVLFLPETAALRRDPRFWPLANRLGYVRYWRARNAWPDFCSDPAFGVDCKAAAAKVAATG